MISTSSAEILFANWPQPFTAEALFDELDDVVFFLKNASGEYLAVNRTLVVRCGAKSKQQLLGRTAKQVFPGPLGKSFWTQDLRLLRSGRPLVNELELHQYVTGESGWCLTTKVPVMGAGEKIVGLAGISRDLHPETREAEDYKQVARAVQYLQDHLSAPLNVADLAEVAAMSSFQLDQRVRKLFQISASQLIRKQRLDAAVALLEETHLPIGTIAEKCGYCDQSAFTRQFKQITGLTPRQYRQRASG